MAYDGIREDRLLLPPGGLPWPWGTPRGSLLCSSALRSVLQAHPGLAKRCLGTRGDS